MILTTCLLRKIAFLKVKFTWIIMKLQNIQKIPNDVRLCGTLLLELTFKFALEKYLWALYIILELQTHESNTEGHPRPHCLAINRSPYRLFNNAITLLVTWRREFRASFIKKKVGLIMWPPCRIKQWFQSVSLFRGQPGASQSTTSSKQLAGKLR